MARDDDQEKATAEHPDDRTPAAGFPYRGGEEPPPALDAAILQAAREALRDEQARGNRQRVLWPLAASVLITSTAVLLFGPDAPRPTVAPIVTEEGLRMQELEAASHLQDAARRAVSDEPVAVMGALPETLRAEASPAPEPQSLRESGAPPALEAMRDASSEIPPEAPSLSDAPVVPEVQVAQESGPLELQEEVVAGGATIGQEAQDARQTSLAEVQEEIVVVTGSRIRRDVPEAQPTQEPGPEAQEEIVVTGSRVRRDAPEAQPRQETQPSGAQEEIVVTGSRIRRPEPALSNALEESREDAESWRTAIQALLAEGRVEEAREERERFLQRYPEQDPGPWPEAEAGEGPAP